jgi:hypothetical protein
MPQPGDKEKGYVGFAKLVSKLKGKVDNPAAVAASIGRKKLGAAEFNRRAQEGRRAAAAGRRSK